MNSRVEKVVCIGNSNLEITFKNKEVKVFDVTPYLDYPVFKKLKDEVFFRKAHVLNGTVAWDEYIDFDPDTLYQEGKELVRH
jgi:Protein of unknown function (DUF2442)